MNKRREEDKREDNNKEEREKIDRGKDGERRSRNRERGKIGKEGRRQNDIELRRIVKGLSKKEFEVRQRIREKQSAKDGIRIRRDVA